MRGSASRARTRGAGVACARAWASLALLALVACSSTEPPLQGYIEGEYLRVGAPFAGTLQQLSVRRGDEVAAGAPLFALERENETAARREAEERLRGAEARLANLQTGKRPVEVEVVAKQLQQARAARDLSAANLKRQQQLFQQGFVSKAALDDAQTAAKRDEERVSELEAGVTTQKLPARPEEIRAAEADAKAAREVLAQADWRLGQRAFAAPAAGRVHDTYYNPGDFVPAGSPVVSILPPGNVKARFYLPEPALGQIKPGTQVTLACDGCGAAIRAKVDFISDKAEYTPPVLYSKENRAKLVYLVEARPDPADAAKLKPGQPIDVTLTSSASK